MRVHFVEKINGPERLIADAEIIFEDGPLAGLKLVGFALWRSAEAEVYVTLPSRSFGGGAGYGGQRTYFEFLRSVEGLAADVNRVKAAILAAYTTARAAGATSAPLA